MSRELFSGVFFTAFAVLSGGMGLFYLQPALSTLETPASQDLMSGKWCAQAEEAFREALPVGTFSRNLWGEAEYALFRQGRKGVIVGSNGWLFTDEEFSCPPGAEENLDRNLSFIQQTEKRIAAAGTRLAILLIPSKARIFPDYLDSPLPACRRDIYVETREFLLENRIAVTDLMSAMFASPLRDKLYIKTDTHWSPAGAELAAQVVARLAAAAFGDLGWRREVYVSEAGGLREHAGDLASYLPGVSFPPQQIQRYMTGLKVASAGSAAALLQDAKPPVALVGTSYSADPKWNFDGFLKKELQADVLNMADEGLGPFVVMDRYLQDDAWKEAPPRLVIWEIPVRYLLLPHGVVEEAPDS